MVSQLLFGTVPNEGIFKSEKCLGFFSVVLFYTEVSFILSFIGHDEKEHLDLANNEANSLEFGHFWILSEALHVRIKRSYVIYLWFF